MKADALRIPGSDTILRAGKALIWLAALLSLGLTFYLLAGGMWEAIAIPMAWAAVAAISFLPSRPSLHLAVVLAGFVSMVGFSDGISLVEAGYGLYYMGYLAAWILHWRLARQNPLTGRLEDRALLLFLVLMTLTVPFSVLQKADPTFILGEWLSYSLLLFYWPIRERVRIDPAAKKLIMHALLFVGLFVLVRNILEYRSDIANAEFAWQVARSRAQTNESLLMVSSFIALSYSVRASKWIPRLVYLGLFLGLYGGLVLTQSRAYWVASAIGLGVMMVMLPPKERKRLVISGLVSTAVLATLSVILLGDLINLVATGFYYRLRSLGTATTLDPSLVNRFLETKGAFRSLQWNPVFGYGMGVPYRFYNITFKYSEVKSFIHNGYVALLFKFGLWGFGLMMAALGGMILRAWQVLRNPDADEDARVVCVVVFSSFAALLITALTANPWFQNDLTFVYAVLWGLAGGCYDAMRPRHQTKTGD